MMAYQQPSDAVVELLQAFQPLANDVFAKRMVKSLKDSGDRQGMGLLHAYQLIYREAQKHQKFQTMNDEIFDGDPGNIHFTWKISDDLDSDCSQSTLHGPTNGDFFHANCPCNEESYLKQQSENIIRLEAENQGLKNELAVAKQLVQSLEKRLVTETEKAAQYYEEKENFEAAARKYLQIANLTEKKFQDYDHTNRGDPRYRHQRHINPQWLLSMYKRSEMLYKAQQFSQAEDEINKVLLHTDQTDIGLENHFNQVIFFLHCHILWSQDSARKKMAQKLHWGHSLLNCDEGEVDNHLVCSFRLRNASRLAWIEAHFSDESNETVRDQLGHYRKSAMQIKEVWQHAAKMNASTDCLQFLESDILDILEKLHGNHQLEAEELANSILKTIDKNKQNLDLQSSTLLSQLAGYFYNRDNHQKTISYLRNIADDDTLTSFSEYINWGWLLVQCLCFQGSYAEAEPLVGKIVLLAKKNTSPSIYHVKALLAVIQFQSGEYTLAQETTSSLLRSCGYTRILPYDHVHHADVLIRAIGKKTSSSAKDCLKEGISYWNNLYQHCKTLKLNLEHADELEQHAQAGEELGHIWKPKTLAPTRTWIIDEEEAILQRLRAKMFSEIDEIRHWVADLRSTQHW